MLIFFSHGLREENKQPEEEMESEKEEEDSEGEMESSTARPEQASASDPAAPPLTKTQVRELRRVKKLDHGWFTGLLDS